MLGAVLPMWESDLGRGPIHDAAGGGQEAQDLGEQAGLRGPLDGVDTLPHRSHYIDMSEAHPLTHIDMSEAHSTRFASDVFPEWKSDSVDLVMLDGEKRSKQKARNYSWVITSDRCVAATKSHLPRLREICLNPPAFPIAVLIRDGLGKTNELQRTPIVQQWPMRVNFDGRIAIYDREQLANRIDCCRTVIREMGKVKETVQVVFHDPKPHAWGWKFGDDFLQHWLRVRHQNLTRLAWFLSEGRGELRAQDKG